MFLKGAIFNRESVRLTRRLKDLLDLSQLEAGNVIFDDTPVNLRDILQDLFATMADEFRAHDVAAAPQHAQGRSLQIGRDRVVRGLQIEKWDCHESVRRAARKLS